MVNVKTKKKKPYKKLTREEYYKALQHPKWQKKRLRVFNRDKWRCRRCKDTESTLHVHHIKYTKKYPWNEPMKNLKTLCARCHKKIS
jgi:5-methylcytosine-specific restriction endonuclease McrA